MEEGEANMIGEEIEVGREGIENKADVLLRRSPHRERIKELLERTNEILAKREAKAPSSWPRRVGTRVAAALRWLAEWMDGTRSDRAKRREEEARREKIAALFSNLEQDPFLNACWDMVVRTSPENLNVKNGETKSQAKKRVVDESLARYYSQMDGDGWDFSGSDASVQGKLEKIGPHHAACCGEQCCHKPPQEVVDDPFLVATRRARLVALMKLERPTEEEKDEIKDLLGRLKDNVILGGDDLPTAAERATKEREFKAKRIGGNKP